MEIKVLGKYGPFAINGSTSSYLVKGENSFALLDCGSGIVKKLLKDEMEQVGEFSVPLHVDVHQGENWLEVK